MFRFYSKGVVIKNFDIFFQTIDAKAYKKIRNVTIICHV